MSFCDDNIVLFDGQELVEQADIDMRTSMLANILMCMAICYMRLFYFKLAKQALNEAILICGNKSS